jgi:hypothetical protein
MSFRLMYGAEAMTLRDLKHGSPQPDPSMTVDIDKLTAKDLLN